MEEKYIIEEDIIEEDIIEEDMEKQYKKLEFQKLLLEWKLIYIKMSSQILLPTIKGDLKYKLGNIFYEYKIFCYSCYNYFKKTFNKVNQKDNILINFVDILNNGDLLLLINVSDTTDINLHNFIKSLII